MDVILSLPILSYFAAPMMTSWSTSLNILFFYMTWSTLVLSHSALKVELIGTLAIRAVFWLLPSLFFLLFDSLVPSLSGSIKLYGEKSLPRRDPKLLSRQLVLALLNLVITTAIQAAISAGATTLLHRPLFKTSTTLPLPWQIIKHIALLYTAREVLTYHVHRRILHGKNGGYLASRHAQYAHHSRSAPYAMMLYADHPAPLVLNRMVPVYLPALLIRPHLLTFFGFTILITIEETASMSGYNVVPGILMGGITRRTGAHYASGGKGNFGAWGLLDWFNATSVGGGSDVVEDIQEEAEKHSVKERGQKAVGDAGSMVSDGVEEIRKRGGKGGKKKA